MRLFGKKRQPDPEIPPQTAEIEREPDDSLPPLTGDRSTELLDNPGRGFRPETYYTLGSGVEWPGSDTDGMQALQDKMAYYGEDHPVVIQTYIYLCEYNRRELDTAALSQLKSYLELIRDCGWSSLFRFAYESREEQLEGPRDRILRRHLEQLRVFLSENADLFRDAVAAAQLGVLGPWGEGNQSQYRHPRRRTFSAVCDLFPSGVLVQARTMKIWRQASGAQTFERLGFHDDYLFGRPHVWSTAGAYTDSKDYRDFITHVQKNPNDGEMPWGRAKPDADRIDGRGLIRQCYEHRLMTLSMEHNYREPDPKSPFAMEKWKTDFLSFGELRKMGCPCYDSWFRDREGNPAARSVFEYLRDFTGYHLMLSDWRKAPSSGGMRVQLMVTNYGFSAPFVLNTAEFVILHEDGMERTVTADGICFNTLSACVQQIVSADLPILRKGERLGFRLGKRLASIPASRWVRTANDLPMANGAMLLL